LYTATDRIFFREILADDVLVQDLPDLVRRRQLALVGARGLGGRALLADDVVAKLDALVADEHRGPAMSLRTSCWLLPQKEQ
jgi:hypothetical protein